MATTDANPTLPTCLTQTIPDSMALEELRPASLLAQMNADAPLAQKFRTHDRLRVAPPLAAPIVYDDQRSEFIAIPDGR
jgi:hypothetical protein